MPYLTGSFSVTTLNLQDQKYMHQCVVKFNMTSADIKGVDSSKKIEAILGYYASYLFKASLAECMVTRQ